MKNKLSSSTSKANFSQAKVLIIEDNADQWFLIQHAIQPCLREVTPYRAETPQQALDLLNQWQYAEWEQPKLILLDLYLPRNSDGWQLLENIKAMPAPLSHIPVIMFSSSSDRSDIVKGYELGIASYLVKPSKVEDWLDFFQRLRLFWWETATLPRSGFSF